MKRKNTVFLALLLLSHLCCATLAYSGKTVRVSADFGFDPEDSTRFLRAAMDSGAKKVIVDRQKSDWVTTSLTGAPNQTVIFENGVVLRAKRGAFHGRSDSLLNYIGCSNVTIIGYGAVLKMERDVYAKPPYSKSEHRHILNIRGCHNLTVKGLTCTESGGDGIFIGGGKRINRIHYPPTNITLKDVKCIRNYRQGLSVITVRGLLCENCDFSETAGTPPESGIDFEPNWPDESLQDIVIKNCRFENNKGRGFEFYLGHLNSKSLPVTARFENCVTKGNVNGFEYQQRRIKYNDLPVGGGIELNGCTFENSTHSGVLIIDKPDSSAKIKFNDCKLVNCCTVSTNGPDVRMVTRLWDTPPVNGVDFGNIEIVQPFTRSKFSAKDTDWTVSGVTVPRLESFDFSKAKVIDANVGKEYVPSPIAFVGDTTFTFYVEKSRRVSFVAKMAKLSKRGISPAALKLRKGEKRIRVKMPFVGTDPVEISFKVPSAGFYTLDVTVGRHAFQFLKADVPLAAVVADRPLPVAVRPSKIYFHVEKDARFAFFAGADSYEKGAAALFDPCGDKIWECNSISKWERCQPDSHFLKDGMWSVEIRKPKWKHRTMMIDVSGTLGFFFLSPEKYWR